MLLPVTPGPWEKCSHSICLQPQGSPDRSSPFSYTKPPAPGEAQPSTAAKRMAKSFTIFFHL